MAIALQRLALGIPDLKAGADFYTAFGMNMREGSDTLAFRCDNRDHDEIVLVETGKPRKFHHISFSADAAGFERVKNNLKARDIPLLDPPYKDAGDGIWFRDPDGNFVNIRQAPIKKLTPEPIPPMNAPGVINRKNSRGCPSFDIDPRPRRLGHLILFTPDVAAQSKFYADVLGLVLSDTITGNYAAFMRNPGDSDHHVLGFLNAPAPGFHHVSFEMASIDETEMAAKRILGKGYNHAWGPGRHGVGSNYFHYFRDPWNGLAEYFFDIDYVSADCAWEPEEWTKQNGMFLWSADGPPPPDFGKNYEAD